MVSPKWQWTLGRLFLAVARSSQGQVAGSSSFGHSSSGIAAVESLRDLMSSRANGAEEGVCTAEGQAVDQAPSGVADVTQLLNSTVHTSVVGEGGDCVALTACDCNCEVSSYCTTVQ